MRDKNPARNSLVIAGIIITITASFLTINCARTKNDNESGTAEVNVPDASTKDVIEIKEKMFISQVNDVYLNTDDYLGKKIKLEGIFLTEQGNDKTYCFVLRYGPGCCGNDGNVGFEVAWDNKKNNKYPDNNSWVEATGELSTYKEDDDMEYLYLDLVSLNVLNKRGMETVMQ